MSIRRLFINDAPLSLPDPPILADNAVWLSLPSAAKLVDAQIQETPERVPMLCRGDLCVVLNTADLQTVDSRPCVALQTLAQGFGFDWTVEDTDLQITAANHQTPGLSAGLRPPGFTLPDLYTGAPVSMDDYAGKKAIFYMWASW